MMLNVCKLVDHIRLQTFYVWSALFDESAERVAGRNIWICERFFARFEERQSLAPLISKKLRIKALFFGDSSVTSARSYDMEFLQQEIVD